MALTGKKQKFAEAKAKGLSNKDAAIAAGYSASSAAAQGSRLTKDPEFDPCAGKSRLLGCPRGTRLCCRCFERPGLCGWRDWWDGQCSVPTGHY